MTDNRFRVIGRNTVNGNLSRWTFSSLEYANAFAEQLCRDTNGSTVEVLEFIGHWQKQPVLVEFIANDKEQKP